MGTRGSETQDMGTQVWHYPPPNRHVPRRITSNVEGGGHSGALKGHGERTGGLQGGARSGTNGGAGSLGGHGRSGDSGGHGGSGVLGGHGGSGDSVGSGSADAWGCSGSADAWGCSGSEDTWNQQGLWRAGQNQQGLWRALARSEHKKALVRSGLWSWAPSHPLICHQQAKGHMSVGRWACGGWRDCVCRERRRACDGREWRLITLERRARWAADGGDFHAAGGGKKEENKKPENKRGKKGTAYFSVLDGCSVTQLREPGTRRRGVSQNRRLY